MNNAYIWGKVLRGVKYDGIALRREHIWQMPGTSRKPV